MCLSYVLHATTNPLPTAHSTHPTHPNQLTRDLRLNNINGPIPTELGQLSVLKEDLSLRSNAMSGSIPVLYITISHRQARNHANPHTTVKFQNAQPCNDHNRKTTAQPHIAPPCTRAIAQSPNRPIAQSPNRPIARLPDCPIAQLPNCPTPVPHTIAQPHKPSPSHLRRNSRR